MFDRERYLAEMTQLLDAAVARMAREHRDTEIFTACLWTDPDARFSAVGFDTVENSEQQVAEGEAWAAAHHARLIAAGDLEQAALFAPRPGARLANPADFALRKVSTIAHDSFPERWAERTGGECWTLLEPALLEVRDAARERFGRLRLHPEAVLGVNSPYDWFDHSVPLAAI